jgi:N utilization substance protein B
MTEPGRIRTIRISDQNPQTPGKISRKPSAKKPTDKDMAEKRAALVAKFAKLNAEDYADLAASPRRRAREAALLLSFQMDMGGDDWELATQVLDDIGLDATGAAFALQLAEAAAADREKSDALINLYAREWTLDRFAAIDRNILRLAVSELLRDEKENANIVINEAIELAKKFGDENSGAFVNGILDAIRANEPDNPSPEELLE